MPLISRLLLILAALLSLAAPALASSASDWARNNEGQVRLLSAAQAVQGAEIRLGLHFQMQPGWKIYWRSPGDAGYPPSIDWSGSRNLAEAELLWPAPHRFEILGLQSMGYKDEVILPLRARPEDPAQPMQLRAKVDYLTCETLCIPHTVELALDIPAGSGGPSEFLHEIDRFAALVPGSADAAGLSVEKVESWGEGDAAALRVTLRSDHPFAKPDLFVEGPDYAQYGPPKVQLREGGRLAVLEVAPFVRTMQGPIQGRDIVLTVADGGRAAEIATTPEAGVPSLPGGDLLPILGLGLLGGLILNLMPCVLPVLSLKVLGFVGHGGARGKIRLGFMATAAGILVSFLALAAAATAVKSAGLAVGWGIQFQQPLFIIFMALVIGLFAANLWGFFEIPMPGWLGRFGGGQAGEPSLGGHFVTGLFATLLATPCTAPFLGTAVGFALARGPGEILAVFAALGLGMALPYLAVALFPGLAARLPRPGRWMIVLRNILGVALAGTALWLLSVLAVQIGTNAALLVGLALLGVVALLGLRRIFSAGKSALAGLALAVGLFAFIPPFAAAPPEARFDEGSWLAFDQAEIARLVGEGRVILVDVTADWCVTCQVNKRAVIERGAVAQLIDTAQVAPMRADWTRPSDEIAAYLASFGRYGIPFNVVYGPNAPGGIVLPELLSQDAVTEAVARAQGAS